MVIYLFAGIESQLAPPMLTGELDSDLDRLLTVTVPLMTADQEEVISQRT